MGEPTIRTKASRSIPFLDLKKLFEWNRDEYVNAMVEVASDAAFIGGSIVENFEREFADWVGPGYFATGCGNGTDAIELVARALRLPEGSEAILPAMTFVATVEGLMHAGLKVRLVDVGADCLMDPDKLDEAITGKTRLIVPVHLYGQMAQMDRIRKLADEHRCYVLEDAAQSHGARWMDKPIGYWGHAATFSFFPGKNLGGFGDGGAVLSVNKALVEQASALAKHGGLRKYEHLTLGRNSRLDAIQANVLRIKLRHIDRWNDSRRKIAGRYREKLSGIKGLEIPAENPQAKHVYHLFVVMVQARDAFQRYLSERGVQTGVHYPKAVHQQPAFREMDFAKGAFPRSELLAAQGVSIPMCPTLTESDVDYVCDAIHAFFREGVAEK